MTGTLHIKYRGGGRAEFTVKSRAAAESLAAAILEAVVESARPAGFTFEDRRGHSSLEVFEDAELARLRRRAPLRLEADDEQFIEDVAPRGRRRGR